MKDTIDYLEEYYDNIHDANYCENCGKRIDQGKEYCSSKCYNA